jgi:hypothetical protein
LAVANRIPREYAVPSMSLGRANPVGYMLIAGVFLAVLSSDLLS